MEKIIKNKSYLILVITMLVTAVLYNGCMDNITGNDTISPTIAVYTPATNDTLVVGRYEIIYAANDDQGLRNIELYVNGSFIASYPMNSNGTRPSVYWNIDSSMVNQTFSYYLVVYDIKGNATASNTMSNIRVKLITSPPSSPYDLRFTKITPTTLNLSWKDTSKVRIGYEVWRKVGFIGVYELIKVIAPTSFNTNDQNVDPAFIYFYKIRSFNEFGFSPFSKELNTSGTGGSGAVNPPTELKAQSLGTAKVFLTWRDNSPNENYFQIERRSQYSTFATVGLTPSDINYFSDSSSGLQMNTDYYYRIKAFTDSDSAWSNEVLVKTWPFDINKPTNLRAVKSDSVTVKLTWVDNSNQETEIHIQRKVGAGGTFITIKIIAGDLTSYEDKTFVSGLLNIYRIKGVNGIVHSEFSDEVSILP